MNSAEHEARKRTLEEAEMASADLVNAFKNIMMLGANAPARAVKPFHEIAARCFERLGVALAAMLVWEVEDSNAQYIKAKMLREEAEAAQLEVREMEAARRRQDEANAASELQPLEAELRAAVEQRRLQQQQQEEMQAQQARLEADMRARDAQLEELTERLAQRKALAAGLGTPPGLLPPGLQEMATHGDVAQPCTPACVVGGGSSRARPPHVFYSHASRGNRPASRPASLHSERWSTLMRLSMLRRWPPVVLMILACTALTRKPFTGRSTARRACDVIVSWAGMTALITVTSAPTRIEPRVISVSSLSGPSSSFGFTRYQ